MVGIATCMYHIVTINGVCGQHVAAEIGTD